MSELEARFVKHGLWTNLDQGSIMGKTITTDTRTGAIVVALLAMLASLATTHLWHLVTFLIHQLRANGNPADGLTKQQQILLRTFPTAASVITDSMKLGWFWRRKANRSWIRTYFLAIIGLLFAVLAAAASIFSSFVVSTSNLEVLVSSPYCRRPHLLDRNVSLLLESRQYRKAIFAAAQAYSDTCYGSEYLTSAVCTSLFRPKIDFSTQRASCPLGSPICTNGTSFVSFDSGLFSVADTFGLNIPRTDDIKYHKKTVCGVLPLEGYSTIKNMSVVPEVSMGRPSYPDEQAFVLQYGKMVGAKQDKDSFYSSLLKKGLLKDFTTNSRQYYISPDTSTANDFAPVPELKPKDADLIIRLVEFNKVQFGQKVDDPLFSAHAPVPRIQNYNMAPSTYYATDSPAKVVACTQQHEYCFSNRNRETCTGLKALPGLPSKDMFPGASDLQLLILRLLIEFAFVFDLGMIETLYTSKLNGYGDGDIVSLPNDQWIAELSNWESQVYASLQIAMPSYAIGPQTYDSAADAYSSSPATPAEQNLCVMQKMRKMGGFANINVFGLSFIIAFTVVVVLLDLTILRFLVFVSKFRRHLAPRIDRWIQDGIYQLQRRAFEARGEGNWTRLDKEIPTTSDKTTLPDLPLETLSSETMVSFSPKQDKEAMYPLETVFSGTTINTQDMSSPSSGTYKSPIGKSNDYTWHDGHNQASGQKDSFEIKNGPRNDSSVIG